MGVSDRLLCEYSIHKSRKLSWRQMIAADWSCYIAKASKYDAGPNESAKIAHVESDQITL